MESQMPGCELPNGAIILEWKVTDNGHVILAIFPQRHHPFVTWIAPLSDLTATTNGHYFPHLDEAMADYKDRT